MALGSPRRKGSLVRRGLLLLLLGDLQGFLGNQVVFLGKLHKPLQEVTLLLELIKQLAVVVLGEGQDAKEPAGQDRKLLHRLLGDRHPAGKVLWVVQHRLGVRQGVQDVVNGGTL